MPDAFYLQGIPSPAEAQADAPASKEDKPFEPCCLSIDLEVGKEDGRIRAFGAVRGDTGHGHSGGGSAEALAKLDELADDASFVLGHNLIAFDLPHLKAAKPDLWVLTLPAVDTLRLSPLAFPRNPYHHLVKHYQDGGLKRGRINDPELDSRLALELFRDQRESTAPSEARLACGLALADDAGVRGRRQSSRRSLRRDTWRASPHGRRSQRGNGPPA